MLTALVRSILLGLPQNSLRCLQTMKDFFTYCHTKETRSDTQEMSLSLSQSALQLKASCYQTVGSYLWICHMLRYEAQNVCWEESMPSIVELCQRVSQTRICKPHSHVQLHDSYLCKCMLLKIIE